MVAQLFVPISFLPVMPKESFNSRVLVMAVQPSIGWEPSKLVCRSVRDRRWR